MMNAAISPSQALQNDLRDVRRNLNVLIRQLNSPANGYTPATVAVLMVAMGQKLTLLSHVVKNG
ncbi:hypothetical protein [Paludibacterium purpuratum]|uniref:Uncharacterized protein n=1 Tax=Paludibacterium purpuratum TaxID=1144873 RepID=A0A4R7AX06_9NEIS|nr:hypothetical protein [Paludibacterium purpuratum]TDR72051.1 hypothetical protein DFP86_11760 [Paludibacterium purpuratum]